MMSLSDVTDILAVNIIGAVPDDENIVVSTNQGEPLVGMGSSAGQAYPVSYTHLDVYKRQVRDYPAHTGLDRVPGTVSRVHMGADGRGIVLNQVAVRVGKFI